MIITLKSIMSFEVMVVNLYFLGICFGHAFFKACQYATTNKRMCKSVKYVSIKFAKSNLQSALQFTMSNVFNKR